MYTIHNNDTKSTELDLESFYLIIFYLYTEIFTAWVIFTSQNNFFKNSL